MKDKRLIAPEKIETMASYSYLTEKTWSGEASFMRAFLGLSGEAGECLEVIKKHLRGDYDFAEAKRRLEKELGDVLYYLDRACKEIDYPLEFVARDNIKKLYSRYNQGRIQGDGSDREES